MKIQHTRAMLKAALAGDFDNVEFVKDSFFNLDIPSSCPGVPSEVLNPRNTWSDKQAYDKQAAHLLDLFTKNFEQFKDDVDATVAASMG